MREPDSGADEMRFVGALPDVLWRPVLDAALARADRFELRMPDGVGPLGLGRREFGALDGVETAAWTGMADAVVLRGPLDDRGRALFRSFVPSLRTMDPDRRLWDFRLLVADRAALAVSDFTVLRVDAALADLVRGEPRA